MAAFADESAEGLQRNAAVAAVPQQARVGQSGAGAGSGEIDDALEERVVDAVAADQEPELQRPEHRLDHRLGVGVRRDLAALDRAPAAISPFALSQSATRRSTTRRFDRRTTASNPARRRRPLGHRLTGRGPDTLGVVDDATGWACRAPRRALGVQPSALDSITGTVERGKARGFAAAFRPDAAARQRWQTLWTAQARGLALPPIAVYRIGDEHVVIDGHHRVSVARDHGFPTPDLPRADAEARVRTSVRRRLAGAAPRGRRRSSGTASDRHLNHSQRPQQRPRPVSARSEVPTPRCAEKRPGSRGSPGRHHAPARNDLAPLSAEAGAAAGVCPRERQRTRWEIDRSLVTRSVGAARSLCSRRVA